MIEWISSTKGLLSIILAIWVFNSCVFKIQYASLNDIFINYFNCFRNEKGNIVIGALMNYFVLPIFLAVIIVREKVIDSSIIEILTIIVSILTAMLFSMLSMIIEMKAKINDNPKYYSIEARISEDALIETYYIVMFEITMCVLILILCLVNAFTSSFGIYQSFFIYACSFIVICNLLVIVKRIFKIIDTNINK